jgi:hypothetical protein
VHRRADKTYLTIQEVCVYVPKHCEIGRHLHATGEDVQRHRTCCRHMRCALRRRQLMSP